MFLAGPNGVGKSALLHSLYREFPQDKIEILSGHRQIHFESEDIDQIGQTMQELARSRHQSADSHNRYRNAWSEGHLRSIVKRILQIENQANRDMRELALARRSESELTIFFEKRPSPLDQINEIFEVARLSVRVFLSEGVMRARRTESGNAYTIDRMSDGERAALLLIGTVLVAPENTVVAVDEPEKHLHPGIAGPLIGAMIRSRPDLAYVLSSHNLSLVEWLSPDLIMHVRDSDIVTERPETRRYDVHVLRADDGLPEDLKRAVLGTRKALLFVEGDQNSHDQALYRLFNRGHNIVARGGGDEVIQSVRGLATNHAYTWVSTRGLIDGDGRNLDERTRLAEDRVHCIGAPTIENIFVLPEVYRIMAEVIVNHEGGSTAPDRIFALENGLLALFAEHQRTIVHRRVVWLANRELSRRKIAVRSLQQGKSEIEVVDLASIINEQSDEIAAVIATGDFRMCLRQLPIKNTAIPNRIAAALGYRNLENYKKIALRQMEQKSAYGIRLYNVIRAEIPAITED